MASVPIGGVRVDLQLNSAAFIRDIAKSTGAMNAGVQKMTGSLTGLQKTVGTVGQAFLGFLGVRALKQIVSYTEQCVKLAATIKGPLGTAASDFEDRATALNNSFKLGIAESFMQTLQAGLQQSGLGLQQLGAAGVIAGDLLGFVFTTVVNFFTQEIPAGIKVTIDGINTLIGAFNSFATQFNNINEELNNSALGRLFGFGGTTTGSLPQLSLIDTSGIGASIMSMVDLGTVSAATAAALQTTAEAQRQMNAAATVFKDLATASNAAFTEAQTPLEKYASTVEHLNFLLKEGGISAETYGRLNQMAAANAVTPWLQVADTIGGALGTMFKDNKAVAIAQAVINTAQAITKSLAEYGFTPIGIAAAAAAGLAGAAQIATILSTQPGSSSGSSKALKTPKGGGAVASAGSSSLSGAGAKGPGQVITLNIQGDVFGPEHFRKIVAGINGVQSDGTTLLRIA